MDLTKDIIYRDFTLNDESIADATTGGGGIGTGIVGCVVDSADFSDVDVVQFLEKRSQQDGMDAGDVFLGMRRLRMAGTLYNVTRALLFDDLADLRAALSPVLAQREEPLDRGYRPLYFSVPTNRGAEYLTGAIEMRVLAMPRAFQALFQRDQIGGDDGDALAIPWQATFVCKDPTLQGASPQDYLFTAQTLLTGGTANAATNLITKAAHGLAASKRVRFKTLTGGTGLNTTATYYVIAAGLTSSAFAVALTSGGAAVDITVNYTDLSFVESVTTAGNLVNRGTYIAPINALFEVGAASGQISAVVGDSAFTITIPASTGTRLIRFKGEGKMLTLEEDDIEVPRMDLIAFTGDTTWPLIDPGTSAYSFTFHGGVLVTGSHFWFYERFA